MTFFLMFIVYFFVSYLITPSIRLVALKFYVLDRKDDRKVHTKVITKLGGIAIYISFIIALLLGYLLEYELLKGTVFSLGAMVVGGTIIFILGVYDDVRGADAIIKFSTQIVATLILIKAGFLIERVITPFGVISFGYASIPITLLWVIGITNAINLIDGLDGLAAGIVSIVSLGLFTVIIYKQSSLLGAVMSISLTGACLGFLKYNWFPAKIFMGDTGSMFLGFIIASLAIESSCKSMTTISLLVPIIALGVPIIDTALAFIRRVSQRRHPFVADNSHIHHWLMKRGFSHYKVVILLYMVTLILTMGSFAFSIYMGART